MEFSAEDAIRTEEDYLLDVLQAVADAGATTLNVPDTVGYSTPDEMARLFGHDRARRQARRRRTHLRPLS